MKTTSGLIFESKMIFNNLLTLSLLNSCLEKDCGLIAFRCTAQLRKDARQKSIFEDGNAVCHSFHEFDSDRLLE